MVHALRLWTGKRESELGCAPAQKIQPSCLLTQPAPITLDIQELRPHGKLANTFLSKHEFSCTKVMLSLLW